MKKTCLHCGYIWTPRIETEPKACPRCKSPRWSEVPRKGGRPKLNQNADPAAIAQAETN